MEKNCEHHEDFQVRDQKTVVSHTRLYLPRRVIDQDGCGVKKQSGKHNRGIYVQRVRTRPASRGFGQAKATAVSLLSVLGQNVLQRVRIHQICVKPFAMLAETPSRLAILKKFLISMT